ncbi:DUF4097 family beta strand repeat-containing protein [Alkalibacillus haloalkaliphilus]|uniref:DUF4097 family beta strand repeat-containing protein n=1 Tax=Alkalibacillus haloalkaliphilus TaxID=94136 RepID=UPI0003123592|nr:DUF4097 family beta strand repeat-containing protein [Alkalibacillus haloalkaliphilus]
MKTVAKVALVGLVIGFIGLIMSVLLSGATLVENYVGEFTTVQDSKTFEAEVVDEVYIDVSVAEVNILPTDENEVKVSYDGRFSQVFLQQTDLQIELENNELHINFKADPVLFLPTLGGQHFELDLHLPEKIYDVLSIDSSAGITEVEGVVANEVDVVSSAGKVTLEDIESEHTNIRSSAGMVEVKYLTGDLDIKTSAGSIVTTLEQIEQDINFDATAGTINLYVHQEPTNIALDYRASAGDGSIGFPMNFDVNTNREIRGTIGDGLYNITVRTSAGSFDFEQR